MAQLYINDLSFTKVHPMKLKSETADTLSTFIHDVGIPSVIHSYDAQELMHGKFKMEKENSMPEADDWGTEAYVNYISAEVCLPKDGAEVIGTVVTRKKDCDGNPIGKSNSNPILDTRLYQVIFPD
jgi:hypothetical protein